MSAFLALVPTEAWLGIGAFFAAIFGAVTVYMRGKRDARREDDTKTLQDVVRRDEKRQEIRKETDDALVDRLTRR